MGTGEHKEQPQFPPPTTPRGPSQRHGAVGVTTVLVTSPKTLPPSAPLAACQAPFRQRALEMWKNTTAPPSTPCQSQLTPTPPQKSARCRDPTHTPRGARSPRSCSAPVQTFSSRPPWQAVGPFPEQIISSQTHRDVAGSVGLSPHGPNAGLPPLPVLNPSRQRPAGGPGPISRFSPPVFGVPSCSEESSARPGPAAPSSPDFDAVLINIYYFFFLHQS